MYRARQAGLTLVELLISVVILGVIMTIIGPIFSNALTFMGAAKKSEVQLNNQKLAAGMLSYARNKGGRLPPERGAGNKYTLYDTEVTAGDNYELYLELTGAGVAPNQINTTGYGIDAMKLYQKVGGLEYEQPLFFNTGDKIKLTYEVGVIYQSTCPELSACANSPFAAGRTPKLTASTIASWDVVGDDYAPVMINTLAEQKTMLRVTLGRLNRLSDRISSNFYSKARISASAGENHFAGVHDVILSSADNGCWVEWDKLSTTTTLESIGLDRGEYGVTAWGGGIEYCRDYKPMEAGGEAPFYAALRINKDLSSGQQPSTSNPTTNVIVTF